ncbi:MAG: ATP-binding cassette domain-containing protein [Syntrophobacteraceae bacterium]
MKTALTVKDLTHYYEKQRSVLKSVRFSVYRGEFFIIIGPNGSGKTTLVKTICATVNPKEGQVEVFGSPVRRTARRELARYIAVVPPVSAGGRALHRGRGGAHGALALSGSVVG